MTKINVTLLTPRSFFLFGWGEHGRVHAVMGTIEQRRKRAGLAVEARIAALRVTATDVARLAGVDPKTIRGLIKGTSWPRVATLARIEQALGWAEGEIVRRATGEDRPLAAYSTGELLSELCRRFGTD